LTGDRSSEDRGIAASVRYALTEKHSFSARRPEPAAKSRIKAVSIYNTVDILEIVVAAIYIIATLLEIVVAAIENNATIIEINAATYSVNFAIIEIAYAFYLISVSAN